MTFDPNATPETDKFERESKDGKPWVPWHYLRSMEKEKRLAEEKLERYRRAVQILKLTFEEQEFMDAAKVTQEKIDEIERVGK